MAYYDETNPEAGMSPSQRATMNAALQQRGIGRKSDEGSIDQFNIALRSNPEYQKYLQGLGVNTNVAAGKPWKLRHQSEPTKRAALDNLHRELRREWSYDNDEADPEGHAGEDLLDVLVAAMQARRGAGR